MVDHLNIKALKRKATAILFGLILTIIYTSCDNREVYYHFEEIKNAEWAQNDTLFFDVDSTSYQLNTPYKMSIEITNNVNYSYQNIWLFIQANLENDSTFTNISKEYRLADEFGKWNGSGFGSLFQLSLPFDEVVFKEKRNYRFKIEHGMQDEKLIGIEKVGLKISKE